MAAEAKVLILLSQRKLADSLAFSLGRQGLDTSVVSSAGEAVQSMKHHPADMVIVDQAFPGGGDVILTKIRKEHPLAMRILIDYKAKNSDLAEMINKAGPMAICTSDPDPDELWRLLALEGPVSHVSSQATMGSLQLEMGKLRRQNQQLENENKLISRELTSIQIRYDQAIKGNGKSGSSNTDEAANVQRGSSSNNQVRIAAALTRDMERIMGEPDVVLPVLPPIAREIKRLASDDQKSLNELIDNIKQEQSLSARILQVANSPMYAGLERTRNLQQAVSRLGLEETKNLVYAVVAENLFKTKSQGLAKIMAQLWLHCLCCAYANEMIAHQLNVPGKEDYFVMGLLHDIGRLLVLFLLDNCFRQGDVNPEEVDEGTILGIMTACHHEYGERLIEKWEYSKVFRDVVTLHNDDKHINEHDEPVIITYFANIITRKLGFSLVPYDERLNINEAVLDVLNLTMGKQLQLEEQVRNVVIKVRDSFFG
jgi:HD-like signal output (HDOD) protein/DNA-binding NarL/FixJ family response regulator